MAGFRGPGARTKPISFEWRDPSYISANLPSKLWSDWVPTAKLLLQRAYLILCGPGTRTTGLLSRIISHVFTPVCRSKIGKSQPSLFLNVSSKLHVIIKNVKIWSLSLLQNHLHLVEITGTKAVACSDRYYAINYGSPPHRRCWYWLMRTATAGPETEEVSTAVHSGPIHSGWAGDRKNLPSRFRTRQKPIVGGAKARGGGESSRN